MRSFSCGVCSQLIFYDNSTCLRCGAELGYLPEQRRLVALRPDGPDLHPVGAGVGVPVGVAAGPRARCGNAAAARCNWLVPADQVGSLCSSCRLTTVRPNDDDSQAMAAFADAEGAKRRLLDQLTGLELPIIDRATDPERGLAFELLSSRGRNVTTGHEAGIITLDLSESDDAHREFVRLQLGEPYRTVLGHLRHEVGHYLWPLLVADRDRLDRFRALFGDDRQSYEAAMADHYGGGSGDSTGHDWSSTHVSQYATMHPWEDWAETFAHYLHIRDGLETARSFGIVVDEPARSAGAAAWTADERLDRSTVEVGSMVGDWLGLTLALNAMSRSIGQGDLYPFVLSPVVIEKLEFVHRAVADPLPVRAS